MTQIVLPLDFDDFREQVLVLPGVVHAVSCGDLLPPEDTDLARLYRACMDFMSEEPEPYRNEFASAFPNEVLRVDIAVMQAAYGIDMAKALWAAQLPRLLDTGNFLDVSRLSDADLIALCLPKLQ